MLNINCIYNVTLNYYFNLPYLPFYTDIVNEIDLIYIIYNFYITNNVHICLERNKFYLIYFDAQNMDF